jgi:hypothetical protein
MESILIVAMGIVLLYVALKFRLITQKIARNGIETEGVVCDIIPGNKVDSCPLIQFVTLEKEWITEEYSISTISGFLKKGQKVTVVYNPDNPRNFFVKSAITSVTPLLMMMLAILILAAEVCKLLHVQL